MRPHKLIMKAFGPFAKETVVDFDLMGNTIYLVSGDTGAGKTTIFDGIIYALYGTASGGGRSGLGTEAFHSDYAKDGNHRDEMRVELEFSNAGRTFTVVRRMYWGKKGDAQKATKESTLSENGNTIVNAKGREDKDDVTQKVIEILGLDADQFRRIIMLAQGEFQKFLTAKSDERGEILGKLYDNRQHQDFQLRLKAARELLKEQEKSLVDEAKAQLKMYVIPESVGEDEKQTIAVDHPMILSTITKINKEIGEELDDLREGIKKQEKIRDELGKEKTRGKTQNDLLDALDSQRKELNKLGDRREQVDALRSKVRLAQAAEKVLPAETTLKNAKDSWGDILVIIRNLEKERDRLSKLAGELENKAKIIREENSPKIEELRKQYGKIETSLPFYDELAASLNEKKKKDDVLEDKSTDVKNAKKDFEGKKKRQDELVEELQRLEMAGELAVQNAKRLWEDASGRQTELKNIQGCIVSLQKETGEVANLAEALRIALEEESAAAENHLLLNNAFIKGQAGILAQDMRKRLESEQEVTCPVCGSVHTLDDVSSFAAWHEDIPTRETVDKAYSVSETAHKNAKQAYDNHSSKKNYVDQQKENLLEKTKKLIDVSDWDELVEGATLAKAIADCDYLVASALGQYQQAITDKEAKEKALGEKNQVDTDIKSVNAILSAAIDAETQARTNAVAAETSVLNWKNQLKDFPESKKEAEEIMASTSNRMKKLQKQIDDAQEEYNRCLNDQATNKGNLESAEKDKENRKDTKENAGNEFVKQLSRNGFSDLDAYHAALSPENLLLDQDGISSWIEKKKAAVESYDGKVQEITGAINTLKESTKGMERMDLQSLQDKIEEISDLITKKKDEESTLSGQFRTNSSVYIELNRIQERRKKNLKLFAKLNPMVDTADGKYAFSRYVLTGFFHRIVEQANIHLETITDGEYCLVPKETGDGRSNIGLDLKVLNTITNLERETATLSGGQLFEASLSLALGLSDVVQMESASSIQIDSMFIDEGFGSLDGARLDKSIEVLQHLSAGQRQIGIISHVARLDECLPKKIHVIAGERGSAVKIETDA